MAFNINKDEILETVNMLQTENLDIRTITMGINIQDCRVSTVLQPAGPYMIR
jgi:uncharacterized protein (UPF0210 family)